MLPLKCEKYTWLLTGETYPSFTQSTVSGKSGTDSLLLIDGVVFMCTSGIFALNSSMVWKILLEEFHEIDKSEGIINTCYLNTLCAKGLATKKPYHISHVIQAKLKCFFPLFIQFIVAFDFFNRSCICQQTNRLWPFVLDVVFYYSSFSDGKIVNKK